MPFLEKTLLVLVSVLSFLPSLSLGNDIKEDSARGLFSVKFPISRSPDGAAIDIYPYQSSKLYSLYPVTGKVDRNHTYKLPHEIDGACAIFLNGGSYLHTFWYAEANLSEKTSRLEIALPTTGARLKFVFPNDLKNVPESTSLILRVLKEKKENVLDPLWNLDWPVNPRKEGFVQFDMPLAEAGSYIVFLYDIKSCKELASKSFKIHQNQLSAHNAESSEFIPLPKDAPTIVVALDDSEAPTSRLASDFRTLHQIIDQIILIRSDGGRSVTKIQK